MRRHPLIHTRGAGRGAGPTARQRLIVTHRRNGETPLSTFVKPRVKAGAKTLDAHWYLSAEVFAAEREALFARGWTCVGRLEQIPEPGDFMLVDAGGESIIVTRDARGTVRAFFNVCRHRGTRVCTSPTGHFSGAIVCPYHAWTYGLDGTLVAARNMQHVPGFARGDYPLTPAAVAGWGGFVFVNPSADAPPFAQAYAPLMVRFAAWDLAGLRVARTIDYDLACNWKLIFQNYSECYHCPLVHPQLDKLSPSDSGRNDLDEGPILGGYSEFREPGMSLTTSGATTRPPVGTVAGPDVERSYYYTIFPGLLLSLHADYAMVHFVRPLAPDRTAVRCAWLFDPGTMAAPDFDPADVVDFWDLTNRQDWHVNELTHAGIASRAYRPGPYADMEGLLAAFDRHYLDCMNGSQAAGGTTPG